MLNNDLVEAIRNTGVDTDEFFKLYYETLKKYPYPSQLGEFPVCEISEVNKFWKDNNYPNKEIKVEAIKNVFGHFNQYYEDGIYVTDFYETYNLFLSYKEKEAHDKRIKS